MTQKKTIKSDVRHSMNYLDPCRALLLYKGGRTLKIMALGNVTTVKVGYTAYPMGHLNVILILSLICQFNNIESISLGNCKMCFLSGWSLYTCGLQSRFGCAAGQQHLLQ